MYNQNVTTPPPLWRRMLNFSPLNSIFFVCVFSNPFCSDAHHKIEEKFSFISDFKSSLVGRCSNINQTDKIIHSSIHVIISTDQTLTKLLIVMTSS